ncbi:hypothetical protein BGX21_008580 [Mortierella sp. AD011]|nr:hypothetical protein BGX20_003315 [Mortierella sp. AD010]KAF9397721.1 hypothetical protein BGX21_008580 [Mortierella sp. AD011]
MISRIVRFSPLTQTPIRRSFATVSPSNIQPPPPSVTKATASPVGSGGAETAKGTGPSTRPSPGEPKVEVDPNPLWAFYQAHKDQRAAIAVLVVCAVSADACFTYFTFLRGRKEDESVRADAVIGKITEKVGSHLINEEGV